MDAVGDAVETGWAVEEEPDVMYMENIFIIRVICIWVITSQYLKKYNYLPITDVTASLEVAVVSDLGINVVGDVVEVGWAVVELPNVTYRKQLFK